MEMRNKTKKAFVKYIMNLLIIISIVISSLCSITVKAADETPIDYIHLIFDATFYAGKYSDVRETCGDDYKKIYNHFINTGMKEGRQGCEDFDVKVYIERYSDLKKLYGTQYSFYYNHYMTVGYKEGRSGRIDGISPLNKTGLKHSPYTGTITEGMIQGYYHNAVFVGDSIMQGFAIFGGSNLYNLNSVKYSTFMSKVSYNYKHALTPVEKDGFQPVYFGKKYNIWDVVNYTGADKVFFMLGTNDIPVGDKSFALSQYFSLINKIKEVNPQVNIYIISQTPSYPGTTGRLSNANINVWNIELKKNAELLGYKYLNLHDELVDGNGNLLASYCSDGYVHLVMGVYASKWEDFFRNFAIQEIKNGY